MSYLFGQETICDHRLLVWPKLYYMNIMHANFSVPVSDKACLYIASTSISSELPEVNWPFCFNFFRGGNFG